MLRSSCDFHKVIILSVVRFHAVEKYFQNLDNTLNIIYYFNVMRGRDLEMSVSPNLILCTKIGCFFDSESPLKLF